MDGRTDGRTHLKTHSPVSPPLCCLLSFCENNGEEVHKGEEAHEGEKAHKFAIYGLSLDLCQFKMFFKR